MNQDHNWQDLTVESKVVASGRPAKKADGELNPPIALNSTFHEGVQLVMVDMEMNPGVH